METYIREFETTEAIVTLIQTGNVTKARIQNYKEDYSVPCISLSFPVIIDLGEYDGSKTICNKIEKQFNLTNCYDLHGWQLLD